MTSLRAERVERQVKGHELGHATGLQTLVRVVRVKHSARVTLHHVGFGCVKCERDLDVVQSPCLGWPERPSVRGNRGIMRLSGVNRLLP